MIVDGVRKGAATDSRAGLSDPGEEIWEESNSQTGKSTKVLVSKFERSDYPPVRTLTACLEALAPLGGRRWRHANRNDPPKVRPR